MIYIHLSIITITIHGEIQKIFYSTGVVNDLSTAYYYYYYYHHSI